jgi:hypothetical protein
MHFFHFYLCSSNLRLKLKNAAVEHFKNSVRKTTFDVQTIHFVKLFCCWFVKLIFSAEFLSVPLRASEFGMPRNECFLPRNSGNRSESNPRNSFTTASNIIWPKFRPGDSRHRHVYVCVGGGGGAFSISRNKTIFFYACSASSMQNVNVSKREHHIMYSVTKRTASRNIKCTLRNRYKTFCNCIHSVTL